MLTAEELESAIIFHEHRARAARLMLDASYKAAEDGEDAVVVRLMRNAAEKVLDACRWEVTPPVYSATLAPMPWEQSAAHFASNGEDLD